MAALQALAAWREKTAIVKDKPRGWLVRDDTLLDIARLRPQSVSDFAKIRSLRQATVQEYGNHLLDIIRSMEKQPTHLPATTQQPPRLNVEQQALVDVLMAAVRLRAGANALNPATLASRKDLEQLIGGDPDSKVLHGWRKGIVGDELLAILNGSGFLHVVDGVLRLDRATDDTN